MKRGQIKYRKQLDASGQWEDRPEFFVDGVRVTEEEFTAAFPDAEEMGRVYFGGQGGTWPLLCDATAVHPADRAAAMEDAKRKGVPTDFTPDGRPILTSAAHQKNYAKLYGFRPKRGY